MTNTNTNSRQSVWGTFDVTVTDINDSKSQKSKLIGYANIEIAQLNIEIKSISVYNNDGNFRLHSQQSQTAKDLKPRGIKYLNSTINETTEFLKARFWKRLEHILRCAT
jgi:hypothetical protein